MAELVNEAICAMSSNSEQTLDHIVIKEIIYSKQKKKKMSKTSMKMSKTSPAAAGLNPFAGHFPFGVPALNHFEMSQQVFHTFVINDQLDPKIWPSKAQTSVKDFSSKHIAVT